MENTVNNGVPKGICAYFAKPLGWNTKFTLEFKINKSEKGRFEKAMEGNGFSWTSGNYSMEGFVLIRMLDMTIKKSYLVKCMLKNINVYE